MTIGFRSILVVNSEKNNNLFWKCKFFGYVSFTGKSENLAETAILKDFFIFVANGHHFQKCKDVTKKLIFTKLFPSFVVQNALNAIFGPNE